MRTCIDRALGREQFRLLIEDLAFPPAKLRDTVITGAASWAPIFEGATREERGALLVALEDVLSSATPESRRRLETWRAAGSPRALAGEDEEEWIDRFLLFFGDRSLLPRTIAAVRLAPDPARWAVLTSAAFLAVGRDSRAWTSSSLFLDQDSRLRDRVIVMGPDVDVDVIAHECAHVWNAPDDPDAVGAALSTQGELALRELSRVQDWPATRGVDVDQIEAQRERLADALAAAWQLRAARTVTIQPAKERTQ